MIELAALLLLGALIAAGVSLVRERRSRRELEAGHARELAVQRERREAELRSQAGRTVALFDRMVEGIIVLGPDGRIRLSNRAAAAGRAGPPRAPTPRAASAYLHSTTVFQALSRHAKLHHPFANSWGS